MSTPDARAVRERLLTERRRVVDAIANIHQESPEHDEDTVRPLAYNDSHLSDSAAVTVDRETAASLEENSVHVLGEIDAALGRLDDGTYGRCPTCGQQILPERLEALPWAALCIDCRRRQERG